MKGKLLSRKLWVSVAGFVVVSVLPHVPTPDRAKFQTAIVAVYALAQGIADGFGGGKPSQGGNGNGA